MGDERFQNIFQDIYDYYEQPGAWVLTPGGKGCLPA